MYEETTQYLESIMDILCCPKCRGNLAVGQDTIECRSCFQRYHIVDNIPLLFWPNEWNSSKKDVTDEVKGFYEQTPFPNYDGLDDIHSLMQKARQGVVARLLDEQIPFGAQILECGCGTGQLSNFLSLTDRPMFATDMCLNSLRLGQKFKEKNHLGRIHFFQMNLFRPIFKPETFDLVICNGVLHHTADPLGGFKSISRLVRPGGYIIIGLYHKWGRIATDVRRMIFTVTNNRLKFLDSRLRKKDLNNIRKSTWFADQYKNPHESKHTIGEVQGWLRGNDFTYVKSIPKGKLLTSVDENENLFESEVPGSGLELLIVELGMVMTGGNEGGFFMVIGQKQTGNNTVSGDRGNYAEGR